MRLKKLSSRFRVVALCAILCMAYCVPTLAADSDQRPELVYFYESYCASCRPDEEFAETFAELSGRDTSEYRYIAYNVALERERNLFEQTCAEYGIAEAERLLPLAIIDGKYYAGSTKIQSALPADFVGSADDVSSLIYYLYVSACESCARAKAVLDGLPEAVDVTRGEYTFSSPLTIRSVDIGQELGVAQALFERYNVPEAKRIAPLIFLGDRYIAGADAIERSLPFLLKRGEGIGTPIITAQAADLSALNWLGTITAGLVGGLNPCALSMLLFFLTVLVSAGQSGVMRYAALYLGSKFIAYLLIGTVFLGIFQMFNPTWLPIAVKLLLTIIGAVLIYLNVSDALAAHRQAYGAIKNQLPTGIRHFLHVTMRSMLNARGWKLSVSVIALGMLVAGSEFLCAGQVYLATLLAAIQAGIDTAHMLLMLHCYCVAFLLPSILLTLIVARGKTLNAVSLWLSEHMALTKWLTAAVFAVIIISIWL